MELQSGDSVVGLSAPTAVITYVQSMECRTSPQLLEVGGIDFPIPIDTTHPRWKSRVMMWK